MLALETNRNVTETEFSLRLCKILASLFSVDSSDASHFPCPVVLSPAFPSGALCCYIFVYFLVPVTTTLRIKKVTLCFQFTAPCNAKLETNFSGKRTEQHGKNIIHAESKTLSLQTITDQPNPSAPASLLSSTTWVILTFPENIVHFPKDQRQHLFPPLCVSSLYQYPRAPESFSSYRDKGARESQDCWERSLCKSDTSVPLPEFRK